MQCSSSDSLPSLIVTAAFLAVLPLSRAGDLWSGGRPRRNPQTAETLGPNLLTNPGMEGQYVKQCSLRNSGQPWVQVPCPAITTPKWATSSSGKPRRCRTAGRPGGSSLTVTLMIPTTLTPIRITVRKARIALPFDCKAWHNPEYRDTLGGPQETGPERKVAGDNSQKYFTFYSVHEAGIYQVVGGVKPGDRLRFSVFMEGWSNGANDPSQVRS